MKITYIGHSCFRIESKGFAIITDPYEEGSVPGTKGMQETASLVLCSHEHHDHNGRGAVTMVQAEENPFTVKQLDSYHDDVKGTKRGPNKIALMEAEGIRVVHMGDIGCDLTEDQYKELHGADYLLLPVGGFFTVGPEKAKELAEKIGAKHIIPMHYRCGRSGYDAIGPVEDFTKLYESVSWPETSVLDTDAAPSEKVIVLVSENALDKPAKP